MRTRPSPRDYYLLLEITANEPDTEIWLGDCGGSLVVKAVGRLRERLRPGKYFVEFGLGASCYAASLDRDSSYTQRDLELTGPCERPKFSLTDDFS
jgi:hypothetical protein